jgi:hypothetical protein
MLVNTKTPYSRYDVSKSVMDGGVIDGKGSGRGCSTVLYHAPSPVLSHTTFPLLSAYGGLVSNYTITDLSPEQRTESLLTSCLFEALRAYKC